MWIHLGRCRIDHSQGSKASFCNSSIVNTVLTVLKILALERIQRESERTNMNGYRIEDEFFTGILRTKAGIKNVTMMDQERGLKI